MNIFNPIGNRFPTIGVYGVVISIAMTVGWVLNIVQIFLGGEICLCLWPVMRIVGIFVSPLGSVLGFIPHH